MIPHCARPGRKLFHPRVCYLQLEIAVSANEKEQSQVFRTLDLCGKRTRPKSSIWYLKGFGTMHELGTTTCPFMIRLHLQDKQNYHCILGGVELENDQN